MGTTLAERLRRTGPRTRAELVRWAAVAMRMRLPERAACAGHDTPLDYLWHAYTGGRGERSPDCVVWACRGGGKTQLAAAATLLEALYKPGIQIRILGGSLEQSGKMYGYLREAVLRNFAGALRGAATRRVMTFRNGSRVEILAQSDRSVRGQRVQRLRCDEVELFTPAVWQAAQLTTRSVTPRADGGGEKVAGRKGCDDAGGFKVVRAGIEALSTAHVPGGMMQRVVEDARRRGVRVFRWCVWDVVEKCDDPCMRCPLRDACAGRARQAGGFLHIEDLCAMHGRVSAATWEAEMLCVEPRHRDRVFEEFSRTRHVRGFEVDADGRIGGEEMLWTAGVDFGFAGAFACLFLAVGKCSERVYVADELLATRAVLEHNVAGLLARLRPQGPWPRPRMVFCDVAGKAANAQTGWSDIGVLRQAGLDARGRGLKIDEGIERVRELLKPASAEARLVIHPRCGGLVSAFEGYRYAPGGKDILKDGTHDHPLDALRYALCGLAGATSGRAERRPY